MADEAVNSAPGLAADASGGEAHSAEEAARALAQYRSGGPVRWAALGAGSVAAAILWRFDGPIFDALRRLGGGLGGDVRRELEMLQQFGGLTSCVLVAAVIWLMDPGRRRRLLDLAAAAGFAWVIVQPMKMLVGRPRPKFGDPVTVLGPFGSYPIEGVGDGIGIRHAWEVGRGISSDLWSMPSSHTAFAAVLATFVVVLYPRLRWLAVLMVALVGTARVLFGAHWPSDVAIGAAVGFATAHAGVTGFWGVRGLDWVWVRLVDRGARPAFPSGAGVGADGDGGRRLPGAVGGAEGG